MLLTGAIHPAGAARPAIASHALPTAAPRPAVKCVFATGRSLQARASARKARVAPVKASQTEDRTVVLEVAEPEDSVAGASGQDMGVDVAFMGEVDGVYTVEGRLTTGASPDQVYALLLDYDACPKVFRNIASSRTETTPEGKLIVQGCKWRFLMLSGSFDVRLAVDENTAERRLCFSQPEPSPFMQTFTGRWHVQQAAPGATLVLHSLAVQPRMALPGPVRDYVGGIFVRQVTDILADLQVAMDRGVATSCEAVPEVEAS